MLGTLTPDAQNGTLLSADEFRDNVRLKLGFQPLNLQPKCDGCGQTFTVSHALSCKKGGLVGIRHDDLKDEWHQLCATGLTPAAVDDEPLIYDGRTAAERSDNPTAEPPKKHSRRCGRSWFWGLRNKGNFRYPHHGYRCAFEPRNET